MKTTIFLLFMVALAGFTANGQAKTGVRKIDTNNFTYQVGDRKVRIKAGLEAGACAKKDADGIPDGDIFSTASKPSYGDLDGDGKEEAIVALVANVCGGNMITNEAIVVLTFKAGKVSQMPSFEYFDEGCEAGKPGCNFARSPGASGRYDAATKAIVVDTSFATDDDAACCPSLHREIWYKWNGTAFVESKKGAIKKNQ